MSFTIQSNDLAEDPAIQSVWYDSDIDILLRGIDGVGVLTGCHVAAQGSPDMTVAVAAGTIQPSAGAAAVAVTSGNLTVGAAHATLPRVDLISASAAGVKTITAGTAATSPKPPAVPAGHIGLAMILVPPTVTTITTARITDKRVVLAPALNYLVNQLSGNVALSGTPGTYVDGPSLVLPVGVWLLFGNVTIDGDASQVLMTGKLWNGTTTAATSQSLIYGGAAGREVTHVQVTGVAVVASGTETWKVSIAGNGTIGNILAATSLYGAGNNASTLVALKIA